MTHFYFNIQKLKEVDGEGDPDLSDESSKHNEEKTGERKLSEEESPPTEGNQNLSNQEKRTDSPSSQPNSINQVLADETSSIPTPRRVEEEQKFHNHQQQQQQQHHQQQQQQQRQQQQKQQQRQSPLQLSEPKSQSQLGSSDSDVDLREQSEVRMSSDSKAVNRVCDSRTAAAADSKTPLQEHCHNGPPLVDDDFGHLEKAAEDLVATWTAEEDAKSDSKAKVESGGVPLDHEDAKKWFYRDPQGDLQGPFKAAEMAEWFSAGYFTMNLLVKRGCDATFQPLGDLIKRWGRVPFLPGPALPPLKDASIGISPAAAQPQIDVQQEQLKILQQQMIMQQQLYLQ